MDRNELGTFVRINQAGVYRYLRYLGADRTTADDLLQETFLAAFRSPTTVDELAQPGAWLRGIARNLFCQHCRQEKRSPLVVDSQQVERAEDVWQSSFLRGGDGFDYLEALRKCLKTLPGKQRDALTMRYEEQKSRGEMARLLGCTEEGVKTLLRRIRAALAGCVEKRLAMEARNAE